MEQITLYMFNMRIPTSRQEGFYKLKTLSENNKGTRHEAVAIVCGGDGTVMWVVS